MAGIGYRKDKLANPLPTWNLFSSKDLEGRMTMLNDRRQALGAALRYLGYSVNTTNPTEIAKAAEVMIEWKRHLATLESELYKNGIASAEFIAVQGYSGDLLQVIRENPDVGFLIPEEGVTINADQLVIPRTADEKGLAHAFINFVHRPEIAAENIDFTCYLCPNLGAYRLLPAEVKNNPAIFLPDAIRAKSQSLRDLGEDLTLYIDAWEKVKNS